MNILTKLAVTIFLLQHSSANTLAYAENKIAFWGTKKKGANIFNQNIYRDIIKTAKQSGIRFIRLAPDKFSSKERDFLIGNADNYQGLVEKDLAVLKNVLDICHEEDMPVVLTMLSLPGSRWNQNNGNEDDLRIWNSREFQEQAAQFWYDLASELKNHPAIVGYNILNEPHPERLYNTENSSIGKLEQNKAQKLLFEIYALIVKKIRQVDYLTPIILDSSGYAAPQTFEFIKPLDDPNVLYSFHFYEPYAYTQPYTKWNRNNPDYSYPGNIKDPDSQKTVFWNKDVLLECIKPIQTFQKKNSIPFDKIIVGEFGGYRFTRGLQYYFNDLISIFDSNQWHWAFYAFREDTWDGMDYELGNKKLPWTYWQAIEKGIVPQKNYDPSNPIFSVLQKALGSVDISS